MYKLLARFREEMKNMSDLASAPYSKEDALLESQTSPKPTETTIVSGNVVQLYRMRPACQAAGHCMGLTVERDCNLYPIRLGWCRERI